LSFQPEAAAHFSLRNSDNCARCLLRAAFGQGSSLLRVGLLDEPRA